MLCVFVICLVVWFIDKLVEYLVIVGGIGSKFLRCSFEKIFNCWLRVCVLFKLIRLFVNFLLILIGNIDDELVLFVILICIEFVIIDLVMLVMVWKFVVYVCDIE